MDFVSDSNKMKKTKVT